MGILYIVATPIGNLQDITLRAVEILKNIEYIACEDTRRTGQLLKHIEAVQNPILLSYYEQNEQARIPQILNLLINGKNVALVSDAGTPAISDPGFKLIRECVKQGISVELIPGSSSVITALVVSGLPTDKFMFLGYLPQKPGHRQNFLNSLKNVLSVEEKIHPTIILFEAPHRIIQMLEELQEVFGDKDIVICRELTKVHEEVRREKISQALEHFKKINPKGEFVILF